MTVHWLADAQCRVVSRLATYQCGTPDRCKTQISNLHATDDSTAFVAAIEMASDAITDTDEGFDLYRLRFAHPWMHLPTTVQTEPVLSGGVLALYDGERVSEYGFHMPPLISDDAAETTTTGELTASTTYRWCAVYTWLDSRGVKHRSSVSNVITATTTAAVGPIEITFTVWNLTLTEHEDSYNATQPVMIEIYRAGGTSDGLFHLDQVVPNIRNEPWQYIQSDISDVDIENKEVLYTDGGVLNDLCWPPVVHAAKHQDRLWAISADNPEWLWCSKIDPLVAVAPMPHTSLIVRTEGGEPCTALASLDDKLIVLKEREIYALVGDPPNDLGRPGTLSHATLVSVRTGCIDPRSVCVCPVGVLFQASDGLYVIERGMSVTKVSAPVEDQLAAYPVVTSAVYWEEPELVLITCTNALGTEGVTLVWHFSINEWSVWHTQDSRSTARAPAVTGAMCMRDGVLAYHQAQANTPILYMTQSSYVEHDGTQPTLTIMTPWIQFDGIAGYERVRRIDILGTYQGLHDVTISLYVDFDTTAAASTHTFAAATILTVLRGTHEHLSVHVPRQKSKAIRAKIATTVASGFTTGRTARWETLAFEVAGKQGLFKLPNAARS